VSGKLFAENVPRRRRCESSQPSLKRTAQRLRKCGAKDAGSYGESLEHKGEKSGSQGHRQKEKRTEVPHKNLGSATSLKENPGFNQRDRSPGKKPQLRGSRVFHLDENLSSEKRVRGSREVGRTVNSRLGGAREDGGKLRQEIPTGWLRRQGCLAPSSCQRTPLTSGKASRRNSWARNKISPKKEHNALGG